MGWSVSHGLCQMLYLAKNTRDQTLLPKTLPPQQGKQTIAVISPLTAITPAIGANPKLTPNIRCAKDENRLKSV